jgi:hypothetical protein
MASRADAVAWIESHAELRDHPKLDLLSELLGLTRRDAVGLLHFLWWRALTYAPSGDLNGFTDSQLARWADWENDPAMLISGLKTAGFVDDRRQLHDWHDYAGRWIERRDANAERMRAARAAHMQRTSGARARLPDLTGPDLTGPDLTGTPPDPPASGGAQTARKRRRASNGLMAPGACGGCGAADHVSSDCPTYGGVFRRINTTGGSHEGPSFAREDLHGDLSGEGL